MAERRGWYAALLCLLTAAALAVLWSAVYASAAFRARCTHGESSIAGEMVDGRFVVTQPPVATGCRP